MLQVQQQIANHRNQPKIELNVGNKTLLLRRLLYGTIIMQRLNSSSRETATYWPEIKCRITPRTVLCAHSGKAVLCSDCSAWGSWWPSKAKGRTRGFQPWLTVFWQSLQPCRCQSWWKSSKGFSNAWQNWKKRQPKLMTCLWNANVLRTDSDWGSHGNLRFVCDCRSNCVWVLYGTILSIWY